MKHWETIRRNGKWRYVFVTGVLQWGLSVATAMSLWSYLKPRASNEPRFSLTEVAANLISFSLTGLVFGLWTWAANERTYRKSQSVEEADRG